MKYVLKYTDKLLPLPKVDCEIVIAKGLDMLQN